ncbi:putative NBD/HSP70 family sugar kinase [Clavibacter sp. B3I6]|uniref:ROK family protein n=1 Tax=Clavibacter sp. B3I6 TaxID=3042268 RepID=UPI002789ACB6|nr:ROK family protein [Clavibacter sp. B3I6]MDQ0744498.1 putative NBD/HSP70 family sugar kinase [Clavibacter sp. B3I6]
MADPADAASRLTSRTTVLDCIRSAGTVSRVELTAASGLTGATITNVVRDLIGDGLVVEVGRGESRGGTPRRLLRIDAAARATVGVQLDRCTCTVVVVDLAGDVIARSDLPGASTRPPAEVLAGIAERVDELLEEAGIPRARVLGLGLATHGPQDRARGVIETIDPSPEWRGFPVVATLRSLLGMPVLLENDADAAAIGESRSDQGGMRRTHGVIFMAGGIGGGVVVDAEAYRGASGNGLEIGHVSLDPRGEPCGCGNRGCVDGLAGPTAVVRGAIAVPRLRADLALTGGLDATQAEFDRIARAAVDGDDEAMALLRTAAEWLGRAAVTLANLFDLDRVVLAGPSFVIAGEVYREAVQVELARSVFTRRVRPTRAVLAEDPRDSAAVGGAMLVVRSELAQPRRPGSSALSPRIAAVPGATGTALRVVAR